MKRIFNKTAVLDSDVRYDEEFSGTDVMIGIILLSKKMLRKIFGDIPDKILLEMSIPDDKKEKV